jgi:prophage maintenance system killer protein
MKMALEEILLYSTPQGNVTVEVVHNDDTFWLNQKAMAALFGTEVPAISKHLSNIFNTKELDKDSVISILETTAADGKNYVTKFYNLDAVIAVGYRVNSIQATQFRMWATAKLREYITKGFSVNEQFLEQNRTNFIQTLQDLKLLTQQNAQIEVEDILGLIESFSQTWFSLDSYDKNIFPQKGTQKEINLSASELLSDVNLLKKELIQKGEATELFAQEKRKGNLEGIFGNVFQTVFGEDAYPSIEQKASHLLYFIVKNHPFNDGNKRSGAFAFIWFLQKSGLTYRDKIHPETLATLTILIAESNPNDKEKMIGIILLLLKN